jgi:hypothetical protein
MRHAISLIAISLQSKKRGDEVDFRRNYQLFYKKNKSRTFKWGHFFNIWFFLTPLFPHIDSLKYPLKIVDLFLIEFIQKYLTSKIGDDIYHLLTIFNLLILKDILKIGTTKIERKKLANGVIIKVKIMKGGVKSFKFKKYNDWK